MEKNAPRNTQKPKLQCRECLQNPHYLPTIPTEQKHSICYIMDENYEILPPSQLKSRLPEINWNAVSLNLKTGLLQRKFPPQLQPYPPNHSPQ